MSKLIDLTGQKFGRLTVIERASDSVTPLGKKCVRWLCSCDHGGKGVPTEITVQANSLRSHGTTSCGCLRGEKLALEALERFITDTCGQRFGRLLVVDRGIETVYKDGKRRYKYKCLCDCGNYTYVSSDNLKNGHTRSCGCLAEENHRIQGANRVKHGGIRTNAPYVERRLYSIWHGMIQRCENPNLPNYTHYGGRGISVCTEWHDFVSFREWAQNNGYNETLSIDRIDVNGDYCPDNCRWATKIIQANNKTSNRFIEVNGVKHTISEWSRLTGINRNTLLRRLDAGWKPDVVEPVSELAMQM